MDIEYINWYAIILTDNSSILTHYDMKIRVRRSPNPVNKLNDTYLFDIDNITLMYLCFRGSISEQREPNCKLGHVIPHADHIGDSSNPRCHKNKIHHLSLWFITTDISNIAFLWQSQSGIGATFVFTITFSM